MATPSSPPLAFKVIVVVVSVVSFGGVGLLQLLDRGPDTPSPGPAQPQPVASVSSAPEVPPPVVVKPVANKPAPPRPAPVPPAPVRPAASSAPAPAPRPAAPSSPPTAVQRPEVPRHYPHIRIAMLAYYGNPMGAFEDELLRKSVDLVVPEPHYLKHIHDVAPNTPQLVYSNTSSLYNDLLLDWLSYADRQRASREDAFFHAARPMPFRGNSPSSRPVAWFWRACRDGDPGRDVTDATRGKAAAGLPLGGAGESIVLGYPEPFAEINAVVKTSASGGWSFTLEFPSALDASGQPTAWTALELTTDTTAKLTKSGRIAFAPPAGWKPARLKTTPPLYYVRIRSSSRGRPPVVQSLLGRDFVGAAGRGEGVVPVFDADADADGNGYLDDTEYEKRKPGLDARFLYESRLFCQNYGQMRYYTRPSLPTFRAWAVDFHRRLLERHALAAGIFMDNSEGRTHLKKGDALEPIDTYSPDYGSLLGEISRAVAPRWILANVAGGGKHADPVIRANPAYFDEFTIRPLGHIYDHFEDVAKQVAERAQLTTPPPYAVLDSYSQNGDPTDGRTQLATLAYYYMVADPDATFLMFDGGNEPSTPWKRHWGPAVAYDVGRPLGPHKRIEEGSDPASPVRKYRVYAREYEKAKVLFKPLSHKPGDWKTKAPLGTESATWHELDGEYRPLQADGTLGRPVTRVSLRNGEGAILIRGQ